MTADLSFGPAVVEWRLCELRSPDSFVTSWQVPVFGKRVRSYSVRYEGDDLLECRPFATL